MTTRLQDYKTIRLFLPLLILLLATFLRFHLLEAQSFWNDEGNSARLSERSVQLIIEGTASDIHPPLYYLLLRGWRELVGETEFGLRSLSAFAGVLTVAFAFGVGRNLTQSRRLFSNVIPRSSEESRSTVHRDRDFSSKTRRNDKFSGIVPLVTAVLVAVNPALIYYSQEARMYALLGLLAVVLTWLLVLWWKRPSLSFAAAYVVVAAAGLYTHYFFPAVLVAHNVVVLSWLVQKRGEAVGRKRSMQSQPSSQLPHPYKKSSHHSITSSPDHLVTLSPLHLVIRWSAIMLATLLLYAPWLPIFVVQFSSEAVKRPSLFQFLQNVWRWLLFGGTIEAEAVSWAVGVAFVLLVLGVVNGRRQALLPAVMLIVPIAFMFITGTTGPEFYKFLVVSIPMLALLLALSIKQPSRRLSRSKAEADPAAAASTSSGSASTSSASASISGWLQNWGRAVIVVLLLLILPESGQSIANLYHNPDYARADYRSIAARIQADDHPNAGIILEAANQWEVFTYYFPDESIVYPFPKGRSLPQADVIDANLSEIAAKHDRLYAIFWGEAQRDPERLVERWLDTHAFKATDEWIGDVRFVTYAVPAAAATEIETAVSIPFGDQIQLNGYSLHKSNLQAGDIVQLTLFWQTAEPIDVRYKIFLHLLNEQGQLVAQRDSEPGGGLALTTTWQPGEEVVDNHGILLPIDLPAGEYTLVLGLYDVADPTQRLPVVTETPALSEAETAVLDSWPVSTILVEN